MRRDVEFASRGITLRGWLTTPAAGEGPFPTVVMAHGFSGVKESIVPYADAFNAAGLATLVYDHACFGASDGEPRQHADPWQQVAGFRDAITFATLQDTVDAGRIGVWGSSYSGGHVLTVAANDRRVACAVSQVPLVSGHRNAPRMFRWDIMREVRRRFDADRAARAGGAVPAMLPVFTMDPTALSCLPPPVGERFLEACFQDAAWKNEVTLESLEMFLEYEPGALAPFVSPTPLLMIVAARDRVTFTDLALDVYAAAREPKRLHLFQGGHFEAYSRFFDETCGAARDWFVQHLGQAG
jgi:uncharacterized protein